MLGGWVNPHREQQTIPQGQTSLPPKSFSTPTAKSRHDQAALAASAEARGATHRARPRSPKETDGNVCEYAERGRQYGIRCILSLFCEYIHLEYVRIYIYYRVSQAEYVIHILVVAPQEYVKIYSTRRRGIPTYLAKPLGKPYLPTPLANGGGRDCEELKAHTYTHLFYMRPIPPSFGGEHRPFEWGWRAVRLCSPCLWWWGRLCRRRCAARGCARAVLM